MAADRHDPLAVQHDPHRDGRIWYIGLRALVKGNPQQDHGFAVLALHAWPLIEV